MKFPIKYFIVLFLLTPTVSQLYAQIYNTIIEGKIISLSTTDSNLIELTATATNLSEVNQNLRYVFTVFEKDNSNKNTSKNSQEGLFLLKPSEKKNLSQTTINSTTTNQKTILLLIYDAENKLLGKDRIVFNAESEKETEKVVTNEQSFEDTYFRGIVTEDTKTKAGRDFYKLFESQYRLKQINGKEIVNIKEVFGLGRNTNIEVYVGQKLIYKFASQPKEDYIRAVTNHSLNLVIKHFQDSERLNQQIQLY